MEARYAGNCDLRQAFFLFLTDLAEKVFCRNATAIHERDCFDGASRWENRRAQMRFLLGEPDSLGVAGCDATFACADAVACS